MNQQRTVRVMGIALTSRGFGYAVLENDKALVDYGKKRILGDKNAGSLKAIKKLCERNQLDTLVLQDVNRAKGTVRVKRIKQLHTRIIVLAKKHDIKVKLISGKKLRERLLGNEDGTKHEMAVLMAQRFPDDLALLLPPKRTTAMNEDARMDVFDAVGLAVAFISSAIDSSWLDDENKK